MESELIAEKGRPLAAEALQEELGRGDRSRGDRSRGDGDPDLTVRKGLRVIDLGAPTTIRTKMISSDVVGKCHAHAPSGVAGAVACLETLQLAIMHAWGFILQWYCNHAFVHASCMGFMHQRRHDKNSMK